MSLRKKAAEISNVSKCNKAWHNKISEKQKADLLDLMEGYNNDEYSISSAYKTFVAEYPEIKISRSAFGVAFRSLAE